MAAPQHTPKREGVYWAALDDGERVTEVVLLEVRYFHGQTSFKEGATVQFVDGSRRYFDVRGIDQEIVQPGVTIATACGPMFSRDDEVRITWLGEVKPPRSAPKIGSEPHGALAKAAQ